MVQHTAVQLHKDNRIPEPPGKTEKSNSWVLGDQSKPLCICLGKQAVNKKPKFLCKKSYFKSFIACFGMWNIVFKRPNEEVIPIMNSSFRTLTILRGIAERK